MKASPPLPPDAALKLTSPNTACGPSGPVILPPLGHYRRQDLPQLPGGKKRRLMGEGVKEREAGQAPHNHPPNPAHGTSGQSPTLWAAHGTGATANLGERRESTPLQVGLPWTQ